MKKYEQRYSGPSCSGICICGHSWQDHHLSCVMNEDYAEATCEDYVPEECEFHGWNENGGQIYENGQWIDHCHRYQDSGKEKK